MTNIDKVTVKVSDVKPINQVLIDDHELRSVTLNKGQSLGLLLALTYWVDITVVK